MRPQSEVRMDVAAALVDGPGTVRQIAQRTGWSVGEVRKALHNMQTAGDCRKVGLEPQRGARKRVPVYARCVRVHDAVAVPDSPMQLLAAWSRWPSVQAGAV